MWRIADKDSKLKYVIRFMPGCRNLLSASVSGGTAVRDGYTVDCIMAATTIRVLTDCYYSRIKIMYNDDHYDWYYLATSL
jgi:hypothetical protein